MDGKICGTKFTVSLMARKKTEFNWLKLQYNLVCLYRTIKGEIFVFEGR
jgi:hypothetical protein